MHRRGAWTFTVLVFPGGAGTHGLCCAFAAPFTFPAVNLGEGQIVRYVAVDRWDNLAEARVTFHLDPSAPAPPACP